MLLMPVSRSKDNSALGELGFGYYELIYVHRTVDNCFVEVEP
jgi:hypothetical protein